MRTLLLSTYELGHQPLALASPAAHLSAAGLPVRCLDLSVEPFDEDRVREADLVAISVPMHTATRLGVQAAHHVRETNPEVHICFYGLYAPLNAGYLLETCADSVIGGEYEEPLTDWARHLAGGTVERPTAVWTRERPGAPYMGRQTFRVPIRNVLPSLERYARMLTAEGEPRLVGYVEASRGCAHRCRHCPIPPVYEGRLRIVQREVVLEDIAQLVELGARHITFGDPDFLNGVRHSMATVRAMHERFPDLSFDFTAKIEHLLEHRARIPELAELGCAFIVSAVESLSDEVLGHLAKGHTAADVSEAMQITGAAGIALRPSLLSFTPWTTLDDYVEVLEFVEARGLIHHVDPVQYAIRLLLPPGSWLLDLPELWPYLGELEQEKFAYGWMHPDPRMDGLYEEVAAHVEAASGADPYDAFYAIRALAYRTAGRAVPRRRWSSPDEPGRAPRLTESWFCCAEPTGEQRLAVTERAVAV